MSDGSQILLVLAFLAFGVLSMVWHFSRSKTVLEQWADDNGFEILSSEYRHLFRGPFFWTTSKGQTVYYVRVRTRDGDMKTGWVRCGGFFFGLLSDRAEVRWEA